MGLKTIDKGELISLLVGDFEIHAREATLLVEEDIQPWE